MQGDGYPTQVPDPLITGGPATKGGTSFITPPHTGGPATKGGTFVHPPPTPATMCRAAHVLGQSPADSVRPQ